MGGQVLCCVLAGSVIAVFYRMWAWLTRRGHTDGPSFAPPAHWSAPLSVGIDAAERGSQPASRLSLIVCWLALGVATYPMVASVFSSAMVFESPIAAGNSWGLAVVVVAGTVAAVGFALRSKHVTTESITEQIGVALMATGTSWFVLGIIDMHLLATLLAIDRHADLSDHQAHHGVAADLAFHGCGPLVVIIGGFILGLARVQSGRGTTRAAAPMVRE